MALKTVRYNVWCEESAVVSNHKSDTKTRENTHKRNDTERLNQRHKSTLSQSDSSH
jgi:hypothetical protein